MTILYKFSEYSLKLTGWLIDTPQLAEKGKWYAWCVGYVSICGVFVTRARPQGRHNARATNLTCVWSTWCLGSRRVDLRLLHVLEIWVLGCRLYIDTYVEIAQIRGYLRQQRTIKTYNFPIDESTLILHKPQFRVLYIEYIRKHSYYRRMGPMTLARRGGGGTWRWDETDHDTTHTEDCCGGIS